MTINLGLPETQCLKPRITVIGVGGAGGNAVNNMIASGLSGVDFVVANTDAQALSLSQAERKIQLGATITQGLGAGSRPDIGKAAAEEAVEEVMEQLVGSHMVFVTAGLGGGTGTGAAPVVARAAREQCMLTVGVVTKPFHFEGAQRIRMADEGLRELQKFVDTLIVIPNQNLFRIANDKTTFADAFKLADDVLHAGVRGVTDLMVQPGLINLDFADVRTVMCEMGKAMMGTGEAEGERRASGAAEAAIANPLLDEVSMKGAQGVLINVTGGNDMTLFEVDEAANRIREEVDPDAIIIFGAAFDDSMQGRMRVSIVATGIEAEGVAVNPSGRPTLTAIPGGQAAPVAMPVPPAMASEPVSQSALALDTTAAAVDLELGGAMPEEAPSVAPMVAAESHAPIAAPESAAPAETDAAAGWRPLPQASEPSVAEVAEPATHEAFIPPPAAAAQPGPEAASRQTETATAQHRSPEGERDTRRLSLFERVTGQARQRAQARHDPAVAAGAQTPPPPPSPSRAVAADMAVEDDILEIPAFLRRHAK